jgi:ABC-type multidrug transport system fused ATPase/permease subunit
MTTAEKIREGQVLLGSIFGGVANGVEGISLVLFLLLAAAGIGVASAFALRLYAWVRRDRSIEVAEAKVAEAKDTVEKLSEELTASEENIAILEAQVITTKELLESQKRRDKSLRDSVTDVAEEFKKAEADLVKTISDDADRREMIAEQKAAKAEARKATVIAIASTVIVPVILLASIVRKVWFQAVRIVGLVSIKELEAILTLREELAASHTERKNLVEKLGDMTEKYAHASEIKDYWKDRAEEIHAEACAQWREADSYNHRLVEKYDKLKENLEEARKRNLWLSKRYDAFYASSKERLAEAKRKLEMMGDVSKGLLAKLEEAEANVDELCATVDELHTREDKLKAQLALGEGCETFFSVKEHVTLAAVEARLKADIEIRCSQSLLKKIGKHFGAPSIGRGVCKEDVWAAIMKAATPEQMEQSVSQFN